MTLKIDGTLLLAGAGNMGSAMLAGWLEQGLSPGQIIVQDPSPPPAAKALLAKHGIAAQPTVGTLPAPPAVIVAAVKPQVMDEVFPPLARLAGKGTVVLSIAAGRTIAGFEKHLAKGTAVVRSMPNTPAAIGRGITVGMPNAHVTAAQRATCDALLRAVGEVAWVDDEGLIDAVTAVSGSGPAYVFYLAECLAAAGVAAGLAPELAQKLARCTVAGSGELMHRSELGADVLRQNVTSPGGTTFAALQVLMAEKGGLAPLMREAVAAATARSRELAK
ncbi:MAG TPA: pyrroline-5-carboxylate reductase [Hyphomicrobiaceae bacterium]|nr:pyrroline-5-carboxylate reductase [Hyphomicrobiaceae bacterium]